MCQTCFTHQSEKLMSVPDGDQRGSILCILSSFQQETQLE